MNYKNNSRSINHFYVNQLESNDKSENKEGAFYSNVKLLIVFDTAQKIQ